MESIRVMMLGPTQSGKTLFLSSMWQKLQWPIDPGFHLDVVTDAGIPDASMRQRLDLIFDHLVNKEDFPAGTSLGSKTTYRFQCKLQNNHKTYDACTFEYLDYAGGLVTGETVKDASFDAAVASADVLLGLIDGVRVILAMQNDAAAREWVDRELAPTLSRICFAVMNNPNRPVSVHFVVSKWDAVKQIAPQFNLEHFRLFLLQFPLLESLLKMMPASATVRLIPVSALGDGFARVHTEVVQHRGQQLTQAYTSKRTLGNRALMPIPINVEIPLICALPDVLTQRIAKLEAEKQRIDAKLTELDSQPKGFFARFQSLKLPSFAQWLSRSKDTPKKETPQSLAERQRTITDSETAFKVMVEYCAMGRDNFEFDEPGSVLKRGTL